MSDAGVHYWNASDGVALAYHELGEGRPVVLLHGLFSDAQMNWIKFGHAKRIADAGFRVIMPDLRAHGLSGRPHEPECYPTGILARDLRELIAELGDSHFSAIEQLLFSIRIISQKRLIFVNGVLSIILVEFGTR